jgi:hypothetical protein
MERNHLKSDTAQDEAELVPTARLVFALRSVRSVQRHTATDISWNIEIFPLVDGRLALVEAPLGDDFQGQNLLSHFARHFALA